MSVPSVSLSELLTAAKYVIQDAFPDTVWVRAELSSLSARPNSHCYMELAEKGEDHQQYAAKVRANCWRNDWAQISALFLSVTGQHLAVGMQVLAEVSVELHPVYGLSLTVHAIDPTFTLGDLARQKELALQRLTQEGLLTLQQSLSFPTLPRRLAVVSAVSAAGYQDFVDQLTNNAYGFAFQCTLFPAVMQGDTAAASIMEALRTIENVLSTDGFSSADGCSSQDGCTSRDAAEHAQPPFDAVILIRGGGASTDLSCFDNYDLAAFCARFPLPVIAGIGHTRDVSLVDHVAYMSVKTPTAAAEYLISLFANQLARLDELAKRLRLTVDKQILLRRSMLDLLEKTIALHSPERIFRKGYSLTTFRGEVVRDASQLQKGDVIHTEFALGSVDSSVQ